MFQHFSKYWFHQLFFVNIFQNVATFFRNVETFLFEKKYSQPAGRSAASARG
jgi:hypothetical protein